MSQPSSALNSSENKSERSKLTLEGHQLEEIGKAFREFRCVIDTSTISPLCLFLPCSNPSIESAIVY